MQEEMTTMPATSQVIPVRLAQPKDVEAIVEIWWQLSIEHEQRDPIYWGLGPERRCREVYRTWKDSLFSEEARAVHIHLVAELDNRVVGFVHGQIIERPEIFKVEVMGRINEVAVHREFRRRGVGRTMVLALEDEFAARGIEHTHLMVDAANPDAQELYRRLGYSVRELHLIKMNR
jgi:ribosomal protein S18 acetylase RimI-like enzyme